MARIRSRRLRPPQSPDASPLSETLVARFGRTHGIARRVAAFLADSIPDTIALIVRLTLARNLLPGTSARIRAGDRHAWKRAGDELVARGIEPAECSAIAPMGKSARTFAAEVAALADEIASHVAAPDAESFADEFGPLYLDWQPRQTRHSHGEHFTPAWLADETLTLAGADSAPAMRRFTRIFDPTCGSGIFLLRAMARRIRHLGSANLAEWAAHDLRGRDRHPLAVYMTRANLCLALAAILGDAFTAPAGIVIGDALPGETGGEGGETNGDWRPDLVVGNPPWVNWGDWHAERREALADWLERHGLLEAGGRRQLSSRAKIDVAFPIFLHAAQSMAMAPHARLAMVITQTVLQSERGGRGLRGHFTPGAENAEFVAVRAADFSRCSPFGGSTRPIVLVVRRNLPSSEWPAKSASPVPVEIWERSGDGVAERLARTATVALPVSPTDCRSPWLITSPRLVRVIRENLIAGPHGEGAEWANRAREGVNTRGANAVFWLRILAATREGDIVREVEVENDAAAGRGERLPTMRGRLPVAPDGFVWPLLRGRDVRPFRGSPKCESTANEKQPARAILLPHTPANPTAPVAVDELRQSSPETFSFLQQFREPLMQRRAFRNFRPADVANPYFFHGLYNVGSYSFAPFRVVWRYIAPTLEAAVVAAPSGWPLPVADCKLIVVACASADESHFLAGLLNAAPIRHVVRHVCVGTQLSCHLLDRLRLPAFDAGNPAHRDLLAFARAMAMGAEFGDGLGRELAALAGTVLGLTSRQAAAFGPNG